MKERIDPQARATLGGGCATWQRAQPKPAHLDIRSAPGKGTTITLDLCVRTAGAGYCSSSQPQRQMSDATRAVALV
jgi:hypothetical protein